MDLAVRNKKSLPLNIRSWIFCFLWVVYCLGCILGGNAFTKIHLNFPGLPVPVFIGELLLFAGILLSFPEILNSTPKTKRNIVFFFGLIFAATLAGFLRYGPLAFRHGAVFAYAFFAYLLYIHFSKWQMLVFAGFTLYLVFIPIRFGFSGDELYAFSVWTLFCLALFTALKYLGLKKEKLFTWALVCAVLALPLKTLFYVARTFIVANFVSLLCLFAAAIIFSRITARVKIVFSVLSLLALIFCVNVLVDRNALNSMVNFKEIGQEIKYWDQEYARLKKDFKEPGSVNVAVYRPEDQEDRSYKPVPAKAKQEVVISSHPENNQTPTEERQPQQNQENKFQLFKKEGTEPRSYENAKQNLLFRIFVWKGLFEELREKRAWLGFGLGKPLRPKTTQVLGWTERLCGIDGWVSGHNSWFQLVYYFGIFGILISGYLWYLWAGMFFTAIKLKDFWGAFLCAAVVNFMVGTCAQPLLEQPHYAIFFWGLCGIAFKKIYSANSQNIF